MLASHSQHARVLRSIRATSSTSYPAGILRSFDQLAHLVLQNTVECVDHVILAHKHTQNMFTFCMQE